MTSNLRWKALFIAAVILLCIYGLVGMPDFPTSLGGIKQNFAKQIKLGLDLQGGTHLILQVQVNEAVRLETDQAVDQLAKQLRDNHILFDQVIRNTDTQIKATGLSPDQIGNFRNIVNDVFGVWDLVPAAGEVNSYVLNMRPSTIADIQARTMAQSIETIRRRIDQLGLTEPVVAPYGRGENEIIVELPGEGDPVRAKDIIKAGGQLEIRLAEDQTPYPSQSAALQAHNGILPPNTELVPGKSVGTSPDATGQSWYLLDRVPIVTGRDLRSADSARNPERPPTFQVNFALSTDAGRRFGPFTEQNINRPMAIVLDHRVESVATIEGRIEDSGRIEGTFSESEANDLALVLRAGALPASIHYEEERTVGPSLGADSIRHGWQASLTSLIVVLIFMVVYYRQAGVNAVVALLLNLIILLAALAYFQAVLTLPGIAGVILTIGMGVDSNVLIFERIREELRAGKASVTAVDLGFKRAFVTIIDTHVTTIVSAFFLFLFGTGPVRGFAVSLTIGLLANLFTSVYVSRVIFDWHLSGKERQAELSI
jgi:preprotein translocase subunit SecD